MRNYSENIQYSATALVGERVGNIYVLNFILLQIDRVAQVVTDPQSFSPLFVEQPWHRMPLYFVPVSVSLRVARTLLKRLLSKFKILTHNLHMLIDTQEP